MRYVFYVCSMLTDPSRSERPARCSTEEMEARHTRVLEELAEIGMEHARLGLAHALNEAAGRPIPRPGVDPQMAHARAARSVRQTVALEAKLREPARARVEEAVAKAQERGAERKGEVRVAVEHLIETEAGEREEDLRVAERLLDDLYERLDDEPDEDFAEAVISRAIEAICQDLGLTPDWALWADQRWAIREARDATAGSPYGAGRAEPPVPAIKDDDPP